MGYTGDFDPMKDASSDLDKLVEEDAKRAGKYDQVWGARDEKKRVDAHNAAYEAGEAARKRGRAATVLAGGTGGSVRAPAAGGSLLGGGATRRALLGA